jgi:hypothetical protein
VIVADTVIAPNGERWQTDPDWRQALFADLADLGAGEGAIAGSDSVLASVTEKRTLFEKSGARAVDMESHAVASAAAWGKVPFAVLRAVADPAGRALPDSALAGLDAVGRLQVWGALRGLAKRPRDMPGLFALALDARRGFASLRRCAAAAASLFGGHLGR